MTNGQPLDAAVEVAGHPVLSGIEPTPGQYVSQRERLAYHHARRWRTFALLAWGVVAISIVVNGYTVSRIKKDFSLVGFDSEGQVRVVSLPTGWTVEQLTIRYLLIRYIQDVRSFGIDDKDIAPRRRRAWYMSDAPAQGWLQRVFNEVLPITQVGKTMVEVLDDIRVLPPTNSDTWEVYWDERWTYTQSRQQVRQRYRGLFTVRVSDPSKEATEASQTAAAEHLGVWIVQAVVGQRPD
jgi:type IV secretory pathway TrbF-like protein